MCKNTGNYEVLQRAKYNVEAYYTLVGMANDLKRSFELLEVLLPAFFKGDSESEQFKTKCLACARTLLQMQSK